jgi:hypothetical protein
MDFTSLYFLGAIVLFVAVGFVFSVVLARRVASDTDRGWEGREVGPDRVPVAVGAHKAK